MHINYNDNSNGNGNASDNDNDYVDCRPPLTAGGLHDSYDSCDLIVR